MRALPRQDGAPERDPSVAAAQPPQVPPAEAPAAAEPAIDLASLTPMMRQYLETKASHPDAILFFRLGDFYEMFFEDAVKAAELLQITLTSRAKGADRVPMCGVPYHSARRYIAKLIEHGLKVAICDQVTEPNGKELVRREVVRVITPGMVLDEEVLESRENNFLAAAACLDKGFGAALLDASTGEFFAVEAAELEELARLLDQVSPRELLLPEGADREGPLSKLASMLARRPALATSDKAAFDAARAQAYLCAHFGTRSLGGFGLTDKGAAVCAAGAALRYLKETQKNPAAHVDRVSLSQRSGELQLDESSRANLEVLRTLRDGGRKGALLGVLDRTHTGMGARRLARWLSAPLTAVEAIEARLDAVGELCGKSVWRQELAERLGAIADLERLCARLALGAGNARDLKALGTSLQALPALAAALRRCQSALLQALAPPLETLPELSAELDKAIAQEPPAVLKEGGLFKLGYHPGLDELIGLSSSGKDLLVQIEAREKERTGIGSLKVRYNKVFGYYLEVTRSNLHLVPKDYIRRQTTVGAERFVTPELKEYEEKVLTAEERRCALEYELFEALRAKVVESARQLRAAADAIATADALLSFARCAADYGYVRPTVDDSDVLELEGGRHPVVERMLERELFVPNDVLLDRGGAQLLVITGPNMAGKSTVMRQVALITLMAQAGSFVPAKRARIGVCDRIFTRVGAADNLARGQSTFMVEMTETANILHNATRRSLVLLDEIGRGTSTFDGVSIAWAVAEHLHDRVGALTLFATHYHELTDLEREKPRVKNCSIAVKEHHGRITFLRKLVPGATSRSYGIEVGRLAGLPPEVIARSRQILANLESGELDEGGHPRLTQQRRDSPSQLGLFAGERPAALEPGKRAVLDELAQLPVDATTPLEALNLLAKWKRQLG